jgi:hypothetical protein
LYKVIRIRGLKYNTITDIPHIAVDGCFGGVLTQDYMKRDANASPKIDPCPSFIKIKDVIDGLIPSHGSEIFDNRVHFTHRFTTYFSDLKTFTTRELTGGALTFTGNNGRAWPSFL